MQNIPELLRDYGLPLAMLVVLVVTGARRMWVFGWMITEKEEEIKRERSRADWWQQRALDQSSMLDRSIELASRGISQQRGR